LAAKFLEFQLCCLLTALLLVGGCQSSKVARPAAGSDDRFLDDLEHRAFLYFWEQANPHNGLVPDRARADGTDGHGAVSTAATGFGLTALCIAESRGWITHEQAYGRTLVTLHTLRDTVPNVHGFYYHFLNFQTGQRAGKCELSSIDTALLMNGVLTARVYFPHTEVERLATELFDTVDWPWMMDGGDTLCLGWRPESGFLPYRWNRFSEHPGMDLLAMGSTTHPAPAALWTAWRRLPRVTYAGRTFMQSKALFTHQYPWAWVDVRGLQDDHANYFENSRDATLAQRQMCIDLMPRFAGYGPEAWGITASDSATGYRAWGGPPASADIDGTIVPCAAAGSLPFAPAECVACLKHLHEKYGATIYGHYGFVDAFNPLTGWTDRDVIGIDQGISLLMAENSRTGLVWKTFMRNPEIQRALDLAHFRKQ
jgi:hypothetical protein